MNGLTVCRPSSSGINPKIIDRQGTSPLERFPGSFKSEDAQKLLSQFPEAIYFSIEDQKCGESCPPDCKSKMDRFQAYNGQIVNMKDENKLGSGGFGNVYSKGAYKISILQQ